MALGSEKKKGSKLIGHHVDVQGPGLHFNRNGCSQGDIARKVAWNLSPDAITAGILVVPKVKA